MVRDCEFNEKGKGGRKPGGKLREGERAWRGQNDVGMRDGESARHIWRLVQLRDI